MGEVVMRLAEVNTQERVSIGCAPTRHQTPPKLPLWLGYIVLNQPQGSIYGGALPLMCYGLFYSKKFSLK